MSFRAFFESKINPSVAEELGKLFLLGGEIGGYIKGNQVHITSRGNEHNVNMGHADNLRSLDCDYTFHTHAGDNSIGYPSAKDIIAVYMSGKTDLIICKEEIYAITPKTIIDWQKVERLSNLFKTNAQGDYKIWAEMVKKTFPVLVEKIYDFAIQ